MSVVVDHPNHFRVLVGAGAFLEDLRAALPGCEHSLYAQFMTYEGDASGQAFSDLLAGCAARGVDVRLMVDGYTDVVLNDVYPFLLHRLRAVNGERARTRALLEGLPARGVLVKRTAPPGRWGRYMLYRNHKKMVVLDERIAYVGGINISDHNYQWHDFMVRIEGPLVRDVARDFCSTWQGATVPLNAPADPVGDAVVNQCAGRYAIFEEILRLIEGAQRSIVIESPYLLGDRIERALRNAAERGVQVTVILPARSNKLAYRLWVRALLRRLDHPNAAVYGFGGNGGMTHAKLLMVDGQRATFGSYNMIELEGLTQKELNVFSSDPALIAQLERLVADDLAQSERLPVPRRAWGRFSFRVLVLLFDWWTRRLLRDPAWKAIYC